MDIQMPVMDGYTAMRHLRAQAYPGAIIALTANAMEQDRQKSLEAGCDAYAAKPIERAELIRLIHERRHTGVATSPRT